MDTIIGRIALALFVIFIGGLLFIKNTMAADVAIYQTDKFGNVQYHKPHLVVKGDRIYQADKFGNIQYHKPGFKVEKGTVVPVNIHGDRIK